MLVVLPARQAEYRTRTRAWVHTSSYVCTHTCTHPQRLTCLHTHKVHTLLFPSMYTHAGFATRPRDPLICRQTPEPNLQASFRPAGRPVTSVLLFPRPSPLSGGKLPSPLCCPRHPQGLAHYGHLGETHFRRPRGTSVQSVARGRHRCKLSRRGKFASVLGLRSQ